MTDNFFIKTSLSNKYEYRHEHLHRVQLQRGPGYNKQFSLHQKSLRMLKFRRKSPQSQRINFF